MASIIYNSVPKDALLGRIVVGTSIFKAMLVGSSYIESKDSHTTRANITGEVSGTGYTAGGQILVPTFTQDLTIDRGTLVFPSVTWANSSITGIRKVIYYVANGGSASADYLVYCNDLGADFASSGNTFTVAATEVRFDNPN